jgi:hypothetical protein
LFRGDPRTEKTHDPDDRQTLPHSMNTSRRILPPDAHQVSIDSIIRRAYECINPNGLVRDRGFDLRRHAG